VGDDYVNGRLDQFKPQLEKAANELANLIYKI
jgi:hypothetical protein